MMFETGDIVRPRLCDGALRAVYLREYLIVGVVKGFGLNPRGAAPLKVEWLTMPPELEYQSQFPMPTNFCYPNELLLYLPASEL